MFLSNFFPVADKLPVADTFPSADTFPAADMSQPKQPAVKAMRSWHSLLQALFLAGICSLSSHTFASAYITDEIEVTLRTGAGDQFPSLPQKLTSGTAVEVIGNPTASWVKVKTQNGQEGFLPKHQLKTSLPATQALAELQTAKNECDAKLADQALTFQMLETNYNALFNKTISSEDLCAILNKDYQSLKMLSQEAINLNERYRQLLAEHEMLLTHHDALKAENDNLKNDQRVSHGLYAAGLIILGMLLAVILPQLRGQKRRHSDVIL